VRELRNAIERAMILEESALISPASLPIAIGRPEYAAGPEPGLASGSGAIVDGMSLEDHERSLLIRALEKTSGNQTQAARLLRVTRDTLRYKMKKFNLK
jgi:DNA-binding NtrC family response regulator